MVDVNLQDKTGRMDVEGLFGCRLCVTVLYYLTRTLCTYMYSPPNVTSLEQGFLEPIMALSATARSAVVYLQSSR